MSRKRDTNWNRDEITVLLDSIMEITRLRAEDGKQTNSREVFEYAAKKLGDKGHSSRAEREKCRTKWKKMKEEFTHAKKAREGDPRYKEAPGIQPFYDRMEEFINGSYDNISPHSTIVRRSSSISSSNNTNSTAGTTASSSVSSNTSTNKTSPAPRASARIAANNTTVSNLALEVVANEINDLSSTTTMNSGIAASSHHLHPQQEHQHQQQRQQHQQLQNQHHQQQQQHLSARPETPSNQSSRQPSSRLSSASDSSTNNTDNLFPSSTVSNCMTNVNQNTLKVSNSNQNQQHPIQPSNTYSIHAQQQQQLRQTNQSQHQPIPFMDIGSSVQNPSSCKNNNSNTIKNSQQVNNFNHNTSNMSYTTNNTTNHSNNGGTINHNNDLSAPPATNHQTLSLPAEHADISYRVSTGCRQITIFGDHDVDIRFRGDCVTINKISNDYNNCSLNKAHTNNNNHLGAISNGTKSMPINPEDCF